MPGKVERRRDPTDPGSSKTYSLAEFNKFYGAKRGKKLWDSAGKAKNQKGKGAGEERRRDPTVPQGKKTYTLKQFKDFYGDKAGLKMWRKAGPAPGAKSQPQKGGEAKPRVPPVDKELLEAALKAATGKPAKTITLVQPFQEGLPESKHFKIVESEVSAEVKDKEMLVELLCISADPYQRAALKMMPADAPMKGFVVARVLASKIKRWRVGSIFGASLPYTTVQVVTQDQLKETRIWDLTGKVTEANSSLGVGVLGMPGATAFGGVTGILRPKKAARKGKDGAEPKRDVIFISAASGAVGQLVGQIAKRVYGCTTIGSAGGPEKCALLKEKFGYDHAIDYKACGGSADAIFKKLQEATGSDGTKLIDMYFENVGGAHFEAAFRALKAGGRIAICGCISEYNKAKPGSGEPLPIGDLIYPQIRLEGFLAGRWLDDASFLPDMHKWLKQGKLQIEETITDGIENWPAAFRTLFTGENKGKVVVRVQQEPAPLRKHRAPRTAKE
eukprot:TRINITY_DN70821_c0_g1_i1.p1 TRINITY_DN70821_c0_g1~~TRINITY_DN70821_c0_g1_i1.p1  ORF type:complete len:531 (+),score=206.89 TRINITY_DN70821_c0_g1_i1:92-1594(+)